MDKIRIVLFLMAVVWLGGARVAAQDQDSAPVGAITEAVDVSVVNVEVWVSDKKGQPVTGLSREDFVLKVGGRVVPIVNFYREDPASRSVNPEPLAVPGDETLEPLVADEGEPLRVVVFVDNTHLRPTNRKKVFNTLREFLDRELSPGDAVMVVGLEPALRIYSDFLTDRRVLSTLLDQLEKSSAQEFGLELERRRILSELSRMETTATRGGSLNAAVTSRELLSSLRAYAQQAYANGRQSLGLIGAFTDSLAGVPGRKSMLLVSDGIPTKPGEEIYVAWEAAFSVSFELVDTTELGGGSYNLAVGEFDLLPTFQELGRRANAAGVTFYPIDAEGDGPNRLRSAAIEGEFPQEAMSVAENNYREPMELVARRTGGRRFQSRPQLGRELAKLADDWSAFYSLGFAAEASGDGKAVRIEVEVDRPGVVVRHREDYVPKNRDTRSADATMAALLYNEIPNPLEVRVAKGAPQQRGDKQVLPLEVTIPVGRLELVPGQGTWNAQLSIFVAVRGRDGSTRPVQKIPFHLAIPEDKLDDARARPARYTLPLVVQAGDHHVAITVRDDFARQESSLRLDL